MAPPADRDVKGGSCVPKPIYFGLDEHVLNEGATARLHKVSECLKKSSSEEVVIEGHCDPRGTEEYNLALGDRRARAVERYLDRLGLEGPRRVLSKGELEATGTDEDSWSKDRRAQFLLK